MRGETAICVFVNLPTIKGLRPQAKCNDVGEIDVSGNLVIAATGRILRNLFTDVVTAAEFYKIFTFQSVEQRRY